MKRDIVIAEMLGEVVRGYRVVRALGQGAMGVVYLGEHRNIGRRAAIKILRPELSSKPDLLNRFFDEARAAALVEHEGVVKVFDCDVDPETGHAFIIMEYLEGRSLRQRLQGGTPVAVAEAVRLAHDVAEVLGEVHKIGIVHRDLKPDNIFLVDRDQAATPAVKILDFGVAKLSTGLNRQFNGTLEGSLLGTPTYMSPEQCRGSADIDARTDVYALGCVLFEMLAGRPPFLGDAIGTLISAHVAEKPPSLAAVGCHVEAPVEVLVARTLAKSPADRPPVAEIVESLEVILRRMPPPAVGAATHQAVGRTQVLAGSDAGSAAAPGPPGARDATDVFSPGKSTTLNGAASALEDSRKKTSIRRRIPVVIAGVAAVALAVAAFALWPSGQSATGLPGGHASSDRAASAAEKASAPSPPPLAGASARAGEGPRPRAPEPGAPPPDPRPRVSLGAGGGAPDAGANDHARVDPSAPGPAAPPRRRARPSLADPHLDRLPIE